MPLELEHFTGPFRKVWSMVGRSLVVDARDRQVVAPAAELGSHGWLNQERDWERLAPVLAGAPALYDAVEKLAARLEGPEARIVDGRIALDASDVADLLDVLNEIQAGAPRLKPLVMDDTDDEAFQPAAYGR